MTHEIDPVNPLTVSAYVRRNVISLAAHRSSAKPGGGWITTRIGGCCGG